MNLLVAALEKESVYFTPPPAARADGENKGSNYKLSSRLSQTGFPPWHFQEQEDAC